jgi:hypothetical protein
VDRSVLHQVVLRQVERQFQVKNRRLLSRLVVTAALAALIAILVPVFVDRRDYTVAVLNCAKNPTLDNGVRVVQEYEKTRRLTALGAWGVLFAVMNLGWLLVTRRERGSPIP